MSKEKTAAVFFKPNWPEELSPLLPDIVGREGYITEFGTVHLLGTNQSNPEVSKYLFETDINGPTLILSAAKTGL
jgi:hypothetical protein